MSFEPLGSLEVRYLGRLVGWVVLLKGQGQGQHKGSGRKEGNILRSWHISLSVVDVGTAVLTIYILTYLRSWMILKNQETVTARPGHNVTSKWLMTSRVVSSYIQPWQISFDE
ncbi:uncharacterized protein RAG0_02226 [Rhynchosporium agropyri]|uniref:Uncharacterized protein n=1 Tax=Rhynchosporium agropyri TaxID=914238 RepID=A0A1E1K1G4_9HELO|nr:uncharacterized protein RAG0_02226 [Rhynchosporium agropyri]